MYVCTYVGVQNLDVNMAVNNLLSRDDGEHEDHDEPFQGMFSSGTYVCMQVYTLATSPPTPPPPHTPTTPPECTCALTPVESSALYNCYVRRCTCTYDYL